MTKATLDIAEYVRSRSLLIEQQLDKLIPLMEVPYRQLFEAARYSLLGGGKRLRPLLALAITEALGGTLEKALPAVCALELVHVYSLIHDDLPCMDDDDFRRGKPSLHKAYPEALAVLTGDFLLTYSFEILANDPLLTNEQKVKLIVSLSKHAGSEGMIVGQVLDIQAEGQEIDLSHLHLIHAKKTGALFIASAEFGGILANATEFDMNTLRQYSKDLGLAFQIMDDILDVTSSCQKHGKAVGSDAINEKTTFVTLMGIQKSQTYIDTLYNSAIKALNCLNGDTEILEGLTSRILNRNP